MPYHEKEKKYVKYFFSFSDGSSSKMFKKLISDENIEKLKQERGISIVYTHFADGFVKDGVIDPFFKKQISKIAASPQVWLAPASEILDRLLMLKNISVHEIDTGFIVANCNQDSINGLTLTTSTEQHFQTKAGSKVTPNQEGEVILNQMLPLSSSFLLKSENFEKNHDYMGWVLDFIKKLFETPSLSLYKEDENEDIILYEEDNAYILVNISNKAHCNLQLIYDPSNPLFSVSGEMFKGEAKKITIDKLNANEVVVFYKTDSLFLKNYNLSIFEKINLVWGRILVFIQDGNFLKKNYWIKKVK